MKRTVATCTLLLAGFFVGALWIGIPVGAGGQGEPVSEPSTGDTNGDEIIDVSDAVYFLRYLFDGGEPPAACAQDADLVERVANIEDGFLALVATLDEKLERIAVATEANGETLVEIAGKSGVPCKDRIDRFGDNENGTVTDICTGLMWQQFPADVDGDGSSDEVSWGVAKTFCEDLEFAGHSDWRLPASRELQSIFKERIVWKNGVDPNFAVDNGRFWTDSEDHLQPSYAWALTFRVYHGPFEARENLSESHSKTERFFILAVRDAE
jgi:hypothetical protein